MPDTCGYTTRYTVLLLYNKEWIFTHYNWTTIDTNWLVYVVSFIAIVIVRRKILMVLNNTAHE